MRIIKEINKNNCRITIFNWNGKYLIKLEQDNLEQTFKVDELDIYGPQQLEDLLTEKFIESALERFKAMQEDLMHALQEI
ncbi:hypothetical protein FNH22_03150 [Fulvivirga sp. M361]|uniref:hypothetical protein n=1 Tax=Fulvivirga sp. M361 TaxID=2594266 RepID=UPI00117BC023|nr:hypothetical protein [Fulvivirga sp. M361]TRX61790.1 hypothetical protein FNH22_03150 [Fulvivirga sp. M361]